jgi:hypothetical protein
MTNCRSFARTVRRRLLVQLGSWMVMLGLWWSQ